MKKISISKELSGKVPNLQLSCIECNVYLIEKDEHLWSEIEDKIDQINQELKVEEISKIPAIAASRKAYKLCGKDPARYRLSAEALLRRILKRKEIYQINNVVDLLNLVSISTGFSIGGYDINSIKGNVCFGIGDINEPYSGIGRGELNIAGMPVFRDSIGAFGTPTSDSVRTSVSLQTQRFLMVLIDYNSSSQLNDATQMSKRLLEKYAHASNFEVKNVSLNEVA